jgi:hypothetical protein
MFATHMMELTAVLAIAFGLWSGSAKAGCDADERPPTPRAVSATVISDTQIKFRWASTGAVAFDIYVRDGANRNVGKDITGSLSGQQVYTFGGLMPNTEYRFALRARTGQGQGNAIKLSLTGTAVWVWA